MCSLKHGRAALLIPVTLLSTVYTLAAPKYVVTSTNITELPMPAGLNVTASYALDINNGGDISGGMVDAIKGDSAFIYMDGQTYSLYPPGDWPNSQVRASGINDSRVIVGAYTDENSRRRPFYYYPGVWFTPMNSVPLPITNDWEANAYAVNNSGTAVGRAKVVGSLFPPGGCGKRAVRWGHYTGNPGGLPCIPNPVGTVEPAAYDINDSGDIVGTDGGVTEFSMFLRKGGVMHAVPAPAGVAPVDPFGHELKGVAYGINNQGAVVGAFGFVDDANYIAPGNRAFFWDGSASSSQDIGVMPHGHASGARELNEQRMVAGTSERSWPELPGQPWSYIGFLWHRDFGMVALPALSHSWHLTANGQWKAVPLHCEAFAVNNRRTSGLVQVVGICEKTGGYNRAVRWDISTQILVPLP